MKVARILSLLAVALATAGSTAAQPADADIELKSLRVLAAPRPTGAPNRTAEQAETERRQQAAAYVTAADQAKAFLDKNPNHAGGADAKKIEAESMLRAVQVGGVEHETKALRLARDYRADKTNPSRDRFRIAAMVRQVGVQKENHGESREDVLAAYEKAAMDLYGEFPDEPAVYEMFLGVARNAEPVKARAVANRLLVMPAPGIVKDEAKAILARLDLPGKVLATEWTDEGGAFRSVRNYKGKIVVFFAWASWAPSADADQKIKTLLPPSAVLVSVNLDQDVAAGKAAKAKSGIGGVAYYDKRNQRDELTLKLNGACTRTRSGIKGYFGENSTEYEIAGGIRASERKKTGPRSKPAVGRAL
jgi:hypothetical protein